MAHETPHRRGVRRRAGPRLATAAVCCAAVMAVAATACSPRSNSGGGSSGSGSTNLTYSWWGGNTRTQLQDGVVSLFEKKYPKVSIKRTTTSGTDTYVDRLAVQVSGGNLPDMFQSQDRFLRQFANSMKPLDQYIKDGTIDVSGVPPAVLSAGKFDGKQLMVGTSFSFRGLYFDKQMFAAAHVAPPDLTTTWDQLADKLVKVSRSGLKPHTYASINLCENDSAFYTFLRGEGKKIYSGSSLGFEKSTVVDWFSYWKKLQDEKVVPPAALQQEQQGTTTEDSMMAKKMVGLDVIPANQFETIHGLNPNADMTSVPRGPEGSGNFLIVSGQSIAKNSDDPKEAAQFINFFLNNVQAAKEYKADNGLPAANAPRDAVAKAVKTKQFALYDQIKGELSPKPPPPPGGAGVIQALSRACDQVAFGKSSVSKAADQYLSDAKSALKQ